MTFSAGPKTELSQLGYENQRWIDRREYNTAYRTKYFYNQQVLNLKFII
jgi:hypothetical protein